MRRGITRGRCARMRIVAAGLIAFAIGAAMAVGQEQAPPAPRAIEYGVDFTGNRAFRASTLRGEIRREMTGFASSGGGLSYLDDAAYGLARLYRAEGYRRVEVRYRVEPGPEPRVVFAVREGPRARVERVEVAGLTCFTRDELLRRARVQGLDEGDPFVRRRIDLDLERIRGVYRMAGYPDVETRLVLVESAADGNVQALIQVREGPRLQLTEVTFTGNQRLAAEKLQACVSRLLEPRRPFHRVLAEQARALVMDLYGRQGFPFARVELSWTLDRERGTARLELRIHEGPRARFGRLLVEGNQVTLGSVVRGVVRFSPGAWFDQEAVWKSEVDLYNTALFKKVTFSPGAFHPDARDPENGTLDYTLDLTERDPMRVDVFVGWGSYELLRAGVVVKDINLFGTGRTAEGVFQASFKNLRTELNFVDGLTVGHGVTLSLRNAYEQREFPSFEKVELGTTFEVGVPLAPVLETRIGYRYVASDARKVEDPIEAQQQGTVGIAGPSLGFTLDTRDNPVDPEAGVLLGMAYELAADGLGGEIDFHRVTGTARGYFSLAKDWVVAGAFRGGIIAPFGATDTIPIQERFFNGGASSVRSFKQFELGPRSATGDLVGGQAYVTLNAEFRFPLYRILHGAVFADAGNVKRNYRDFDLTGLRYGLGGGLYLNTPVGPARLDVAANPNPSEDEDSWALHVSVGYAF